MTQEVRLDDYLVRAVRFLTAENDRRLDAWASHIAALDTVEELRLLDESNAIEALLFEATVVDGYEFVDHSTKWTQQVRNAIEELCAQFAIARGIVLPEHEYEWWGLLVKQICDETRQKWGWDGT